MAQSKLEGQKPRAFQQTVELVINLRGSLEMESDYGISSPDEVRGLQDTYKDRLEEAKRFIADGENLEALTLSDEEKSDPAYKLLADYAKEFKPINSATASKYMKPIKPDCSNEVKSPISMMVLGGFIAVTGVIAAIAFLMSLKAAVIFAAAVGVTGLAYRMFTACPEKTSEKMVEHTTSPM